MPCTLQADSFQLHDNWQHDCELFKEEQVDMVWPKPRQNLSSFFIIANSLPENKIKAQVICDLSVCL